MSQVWMETREQPGGRTGQNVTVNAHLGCMRPAFTMPYEKGDEEPHRTAVEQMIQRLRSNRYRVFGKDEQVTIVAISPGYWVAKGEVE